MMIAVNLGLIRINRYDKIYYFRSTIASGVSWENNEVNTHINVANIYYIVYVSVK